MIPFLTHFVALLFAGYALFRLWQANRSGDRWINIVISAGFLGRAVVGQILFWVSYARLPLARGLQMGDGLWFFARDALEYFPTASRLAQEGVGAIIEYPTSGASVAFVKVLAISVFLLGTSTAVALLLNLFCYLGTTVVIVRWSEREPRARPAAALAICAISLSPASFLWSLQPLKDTFFQFVVIAFIGACAAWQRRWTEWPVRMPGAFLVFAAMTVTLLAISGVRWYFAFALLMASLVFLLLVALLSPGRKAVAFTATAVLVIVLSRVFLLGAGSYVPIPIVRVMTPSTAFGEVRKLPSQIIGRINTARDGFDQVGGATSIHLGGTMSKFARALGAAPGSETQTPGVNDPPIQEESTKEVAKARPAPLAPATQPKQASNPVKMTGATMPAQPPKVSSSAPKPMASTSASAKPMASTSTPPKPMVSTSTSLKPVASTSTSPKPMSSTSAPPKPVPAPPAVTISGAPVKRKPLVLQARRPGSKRAATLTRLLMGVTSVVVPRSIGERLGLFHIGGGQGMFWFTELDTVIFDLIVLCAAFALVLRRSVFWRNPLVWFLALLTLLAGLPLAYVVTNYGTLFRLREMIYIGLALTPLALATSWRRDETAAPPGAAPAS